MPYRNKHLYYKPILFSHYYKTNTPLIRCISSHLFFSLQNNNIGPNGPIGSAYMMTIGKFATDPEIPVKINIMVRFLYNQEDM